MPDLKSKHEVIYIDRFLGCDFRTGSLLDNIRRSPDAVNMDFGEEMHTPVKRTGFTPVISRALDGRVNGFHQLETDVGEYRLIHAGTKLYHLIGSEATVIYSDMANAPSCSFVMDGKLYILDGRAYLVFDGGNVVKVSDHAYIPTTAIEGSAHERPNRLTGLRRNIFYGNGNVRLFSLDVEWIDNLAVYAYIDGVLTLEGTGLTVNRTAGSIELTAAPRNGAVIDICFSKTDTAGMALINRCRYFTFESENNGTGVKFYGNPETPQAAYLSSPLNPEYFPDDGNTFVSEDHGCIAPRSLCKLGDEQLFLARRGVCTAVAALFGDRRIIHNLSVFVNNLLTAETNLNDAISVIIKTKLYLFVNNSVYVADERLRQSGRYGQYEWHRWTGVPATAAVTWGERLFFGTADGNVYRFMTHKDDGNNIYHDDGAPVCAHWATPFLGTPVTGGGIWSRRKTVPASAAVVLQPFLRSGADIYAAAEDTGYSLIKSVSTSLLDFTDVDFSNFTFNCINRPRTITIKNVARRFESLQLLIKNDRPEGLGLVAAEIRMIAGAEVKGE